MILKTGIGLLCIDEVREVVVMEAAGTDIAYLLL
jgi:hypothetical protein